MDTKTAHEMLEEFHAAFVPAVTEVDLRSVRGDMLVEEAEEVGSELEHTTGEPDLMAYLAMGIASGIQKFIDEAKKQRLFAQTDVDVPTVDRENLAKELADLVYVAYGSALVWGIDLDIALREVHESNMTKLDEDGRAIMDGNGKIIKGPNYREPLMGAALREG